MRLVRRILITASIFVLSAIVANAEASNQFALFESGTVDSLGTISVRESLEKAGYSVEWNQRRAEASARKKSETVVMKANSKVLIINNQVIILEDSPYLSKGKLLISVGSLNRALDWEEAEKIPDEKILAYNDAIGRAIKASIEYQSADINHERATKTNEELALTASGYSLFEIQTKKELDVHEKWAEMQKEIIKEVIANDVRNQMDAFSLLQEQKKYTVDKTDFQKRKYELNKLLYKYGNISVVELKKIKEEYELNLLDLEIINTEIEEMAQKLTKVIGGGFNDASKLEYAVDYNPGEDENWEERNYNLIEGDPYVWYCKQNMELTEFKLNTYEYNVLGGKSYSLTKLDLTEARKNLNSVKVQFDFAIKQRHVQLKKIEQGIKKLEISEEQAEDFLNTTRLQYDLGLATKIQLEEAQMNIGSIQLEIKKNKQQHEQMKRLCEKPYLAPEYFQS